jgi:hypothetical protein
MSKSRVVSNAESINGYKEIRYADGGTYKGEWKDGLPSGKGTSVSPIGDIYTGDFLGGVPHGTGVHQWANGEKYEGKYINGKQHGKENLLDIYDSFL